MPIAFIVAPANENEKRHAYNLLDKTLEATKGRVRKVVADSQYSSKRFRKKAVDCGVESVIPYPANQRPREKGLLRVDKHFRTHAKAKAPPPSVLPPTKTPRNSTVANWPGF